MAEYRRALSSFSTEHAYHIIRSVANQLDHGIGYTLVSVGTESEFRLFCIGSTYYSHESRDHNRHLVSASSRKSESHQIRFFGPTSRGRLG